MSWKDDFDSDAGWSAIDCSTQLLGTKGAKFRKFLKDRGVDFVIRYYAPKPIWKTISVSEAQGLRDDGLKLLTVFQAKSTKASDFSKAKGKTAAKEALAFAVELNQPDGTTILFAVDGDMVQSEINSSVIPYFEGVNEVINGRYRIGAYAGGLTLSNLLKQGLIEIPWLTMSPGFTGTKEFFQSGKWGMRQVRPTVTHAESTIEYDRNVLNWKADKFGAFLYGEPAAIAKSSGVSAASGVVYVRTQGLNLRKTPNGEIDRSLNIADPVIDKGPSGVEGWRKVSADGDDGFVAERYLRPPVAPEVEALLRSTVDEWLRFDMGTGRENKEPYSTYIGEMWSAINESWTGMDDVRWSAAFVSWVVRKSGTAYKEFKFNARHSAFVNDAIRARRINQVDKPFWGYRVSEARPDLGDIIQFDSTGQGYNFDYAENHAGYSSHSDIVVEVTPELVKVIGGNISNTVSYSSGTAGSYRVFALTPEGLISSGQGVIALLKNRAALVPA